MTAIGIVDYGMGNRRSVEKAVERAGARPVLTGDHARLREADGLIVPGVGAFARAMRSLSEAGLDELVVERAGAGTPVFGACLGMQLLFERSEEGEGVAGLGLLRGDVRRLDTRGLKLPQMGWNDVRWQRDTELNAGLPDPSIFYHVHSYVPHPADPDDVLGVSEYGSPFVTVVGRENVYGAQFHPEKSSTHGLALLGNFARICARVAA
ncbi:MAG TPA: imidazole glycerol phosphate synthase subunit HisH [Solirubrobacteraceae bacterium]|nr:imidazole glycerol phosphate synthase subunit HisH [Solirubrobacteraceae bacterium]